VPARDDTRTISDPGAGSTHKPSVECLDAALWYERSTLEALVAAMSIPPRRDDRLEPLIRARRMARLLSSVEMAALTAALGPAPDLATAIGGGWAGVLREHDAALQRLTEQVDYAAARLSPLPRAERSRLENASSQQAR
jgi:hypothetical protein